MQTMTRRSMRQWLAAAAIALALGALAAARGAAGAEGGPRVVEVQDRCDPATFNAAIGPGTCVGNGNVTIDEFIAELTKDQQVGAWRFNPDQFNQKPGQPFLATNTGGETHTFSCVTTFGGGFVPILNSLSGNTTPAVRCDPAQDDNFLAPGQSTGVIAPNAAGIYRFQCLIHPWMRTTVAVER